MKMRRFARKALPATTSAVATHKSALWLEASQAVRGAAEEQQQAAKGRLGF
jgi:hypothetical protein